MKVPKGWKIASLDAVAEIQTGIAKGVHDSQKMVLLPYLRVANVQDGYVDLSEIKEISVPEDKVARFLLRRGDLLMTEGGDFDKLGRGCIWDGQISPCLHQNHVFAVRVTSNKLDNRFLAMLAASPYGRRYFTSCSKQSTNLASINTTQLREFPVLLPALSEQRRIAEILGTSNRAIATQQKLITAKTARLRTLRHQLLTGSRRFPEFQGKWKKMRMSDVASINDSVLAETTPRDFEFTYITISDVTDGRICYPMEKTRFGEASSRARRRIQRDDVLLSMVRPNLEGFAQVASVQPQLVCSTGFAVLRAKEDVEPSILFHNLFTPRFHAQYMALTTGSSYPALSPGDVGGLLLMWPPTKAEQTRIATVLNAAQREIDLLTNQLESLNQQKRGLMQKLLTGEIRLKA